MARTKVPGGARQRRTISVRPTSPESDAIQALAAQWDCSLSQAALRLLRVGLAAPDSAPLSERASVICAQATKGLSRADLFVYATTTWGLTRKQAYQLIAEAQAYADRQEEAAA